LSVLSPRYFDSKWCVKEVNTFCLNAKKSGGLKIGNKLRVFRVLTKSFDREALSVFPDLTDKSAGYEFFQQDERERESWLDPAMGSGEEYRRRIYYLADEIAELIRGFGDEQKARLEPESGALQPEEQPLNVYLADCGYDQRENREKVADSLRGHGYRIFPEGRLPDLEVEVKEATTEILSECQLSVHLIGSSYGVVPDGPSGKSNVILQNEMAASHSSATGMKRLIWIPRDLKVENPKQLSFLETLRQTSEAQHGADLIEGDLETLKANMHRTLLDIQTKTVDPINVIESDEKIVYLLCAQRDRGETIELRKFLKQQGYQAKIPVFEGDAKTVRTANESNFNAAHAVILFYGDTDEAWRATTENELTRMSGLRETLPLQASFTYLAGPETVDKKEMIELEEDGVINGLSGFSDHIMTGFIAALSA